MTNDPREALQDAAAAHAEDMQAFQDEANAETVDTDGDNAVCCVCEFVHCECDEFDAEFEADEDDGQPTMYEEYQDLYGGDDWDQGQYDDDGW
jgi:hypothetical protein